MADLHDWSRQADGGYKSIVSWNVNIWHEVQGRVMRLSDSSGWRWQVLFDGRVQVEAEEATLAVACAAVTRHMNDELRGRGRPEISQPGQTGMVRGQ